MLHIRLVTTIIFLTFPLTLWAGERGNNSGYLGFSPMSAQSATFVTPTAEVGVMMGDTLLLAIEYGSSSLNFGNHDEEEEHGSMMAGGWGQMTEERWETQESLLEIPTDSLITGTQTNSGIKARWFFSENFNLLFAVNQRNTSGKAEIPVSGSTITAVGNYTANALVQSIGIGSQWFVMDSVVMGVDWAVGSKEISSSTSVTMETNSGLSTNQQEVAQTQIEDFGGSVNQLMSRSGGLTIFMGWAF